MKKWLIRIVIGLLAVGAGAAAYIYYQSIERPEVIKIDGIYDEQGTYGSLVIEASNVSLENKEVSGSLTIASDGGHDIFLRNVDVEGDIIIRNAMEEYTLYLDDVSARKIKIDSEHPIHIELLSASAIKDVETNQDITITSDPVDGQASLKNVTVNDKANAQIMLKGTGLNTMILNTTANVITDASSMIDNLIVNKAATVVNEGDIGLLSANANVSYYKKPANIAASDKAVVKDINEVTTKVTTTRATTQATTTTNRRGSTTAPTTTANSQSSTSKKVTTKATLNSTNTTTTIKPANTPPVIAGEDIVIMAGAKFNPLQGMSVTDAEDGRGKLTESHIVANDVIATQAGYYTITYRYTDKGGLTTTFTRQVTVNQDPKKMVAPKNLRYNYDNEGALQFAWDLVPGAYDYNVYVNGALIESGVRRNYTYVEDYVNVNQPNELAVVAYASPAVNLEPSVAASIKYNADKGYVNMPSLIYADSTKATSIFFRFNDLYVNTRPINKVKIKVERYINRQYVPVSDLKLAYNKRTDENGETTLYDHPRSGTSLEAYFTQQGSYRMTFTLLDTKGINQTLEHKFDVLNIHGDMEQVYSEPVVSDFYVTYYGGSNYSRTDWSAYLVFYLPMDINTRYPEDDIKVTFYYHTAQVAEAKIVEFTAADMRLSRKEINANEIIRVILTKGDSEAFDTFMNDNFDKPVNISAKITVTDNGKAFTTATRKIRLS